MVEWGSAGKRTAKCKSSHHHPVLFRGLLRARGLTDNLKAVPMRIESKLTHCHRSIIMDCGTTGEGMIMKE
jgi:hypothetical protein